MFSWEEYPHHPVSSDQSSSMTHVEVLERVHQLQRIQPDAIRVKQIGLSVEGRPILLVSVGTGGKRVLAWSQMHGDEPTHTVVLLDLIDFLQQAPDHPCAQAITEGCTLHLIPMLNPDGASRGTRRNAQGIDINRDARHLQSPEGRILRKTVQDLLPHFAFNLHNQRARTTVGHTQQPAAVSLLVPTVDPQSSSDTRQITLAEKVASCFLHAVEPHCRGMISRYDADFMPRAFGEWVQQQGAATVLVEAGGMPRQSRSTLKQLHFHGLASTLYDLATNAHLQIDEGAYQMLPRSGEHDLFDLLIREVTVSHRNGSAPFVTDLGINFPRDGKPGSEAEQGATVQDLGDLHVTTGRLVVDGRELVCLPGRVVMRADCSPLQPPDDALVQRLLATGVTSLIGQIDLTSEDEIAAIEDRLQQISLPINIGYLVAGPSSAAGWSDILRDRLLFCVSQGILGLVAEDLPADIQSYLKWFGLPLISLRRQSHDVSECLKRLGRGTIRLGAVADLVLVRSNEMQTENGDSADVPQSAVSGQTDWSTVHQVILGGHVVFDCGQVLCDSGGVMLRRRWGTRAELDS